MSSASFVEQFDRQVTGMLQIAHRHPVETSRKPEGLPQVGQPLKPDRRNERVSGARRSLGR
jgi:hypothetical protein